MPTFQWSRTSPGWTWRAAVTRHGCSWSSTLWRRDPWRVACGWVAAWLTVTSLVVMVWGWA